MAPILEARGLSKQFGGVYALRDVALTVHAGEIHGLIGQNGSGKSTFIKILGGYHAPESGGELYVNGQSVPLPVRPGQFRQLGISFVHQDLGLVDSRSVLDNLRVNRYRPDRFHTIRWRDERRSAAKVLARFGLQLDLEGKVSALSEVNRALLAIVRAVRDLSEGQNGNRQTGVGLLVLDEPTVYLPRDSVDILFGVMRDVAASGQGILFVSHQLGEVKEITEHVSVLRDGRLVGCVATTDSSEDSLIEMVLGRRLDDLYPEHLPAGEEDLALSVRGLSGGSAADVSLSVRPGEILGLTGLVGAGFDDVPYLIYGAQRATSGSVDIGGRRFAAASIKPQDSIRQGMALVPANRLRDGVALNRTVEENVAGPILKEHVRRGRIRRSRLREAVRAMIRTCDVRPDDPQRRMSTLSGGNQQKAVLAKWLQTRPAVLLMHEPTQGVDVGARKQIFSLINHAAQEGAAIIVASSEQEDLAHICGRVLVFRAGRVVSEVRGGALSTERLLDESYRAATDL
jgi:ribose transport system ATP-binding protein